MYYDEAINTLRMDATFGLPVRRSIRREGWTGRWVEWLDGHVTVGIDRNLLPIEGFQGAESIEPLISTEDLSARDWIVEESRCRARSSHCLSRARASMTIIAR